MYEDHVLEKTLFEHFGFECFRPGQKQVIQTLLSANRVLCIQPTGYGKSLLYQLPAVILPGLTLVITPLLALMRDQIRQLNGRFSIAAAGINSDQSEEENQKAMQAAREERLRILFIAPERLDNLEVSEFLQGLEISLIVVDEAHCISTWGHDFRPAYRQIIHAVRDFSAREQPPRVLALTATANHRTEADIVRQLTPEAGAEPLVMRSGMDRPNLSLAVLPVSGMAEKLAFLESFLAQANGCGLLYCATREQTEITARYLSERGLPVKPYHAGLPPDQKRALQEAFISGKQAVIAATNALGMGIDKADLRFIVHVDVPGSVTAYYQEVGRAGRDGGPARGILLFDEADRRVQDFFINNSQPTAGDFEMVLSAVRNHNGDPPRLTELKLKTGLHPTRVNVVTAELMEQGFIRKILDEKRRQIYVPGEAQGRVDMSRYERQLEVRTEELNGMMAYGSGDVDCYMAFLRKTLGDDQAEVCGRCSFCVADQWDILKSQVDTEFASEWMLKRPLPIPESKYPPMSEGQAVFSTEMGTPHFAMFMRQRSNREGFQAPGHIAEALAAPILARAHALARFHQFAAICALPSRTWVQRETMLAQIAEHLGIQALPDLLYWNPYPAKRQGQLLNTEQRKANVKQRIHVDGDLHLPKGADLLLFDDYFGSMATLKEACRALRKTGFKGDIVPFTIARVRWRFGKPGMVV